MQEGEGFFCEIFRDQETTRSRDYEGEIKKILRSEWATSALRSRERGGR